jgi:hypothetical protein
MVTRNNKDRAKKKKARNALIEVQRGCHYNYHWIGIAISFRTHSLAFYLYDERRELLTGPLMLSWLGLQ